VIHVRRWAPLAVLVLLPSALILPILFSGKMLYGHDVESVFHYQRQVIAQAFREGRLPVWDPHVMAGFPLLAGLQAAVFYPPTWLCVLIPAGAFWTLSVWLHLILAGVFAHRWLERGMGLGAWSALAGSLLFMTSGYLFARIQAGHVNYVWAYPWIAALLWRLDRFLAGATIKRGALLGVGVSMILLAGLPQYVFFGGLLSAARLGHFVLARREKRSARLKVAGVAAAWLALGLLLCAPQLFPTLELINLAQRGDTNDRKFLLDYALKPGDLRGLVLGEPGGSYEDYRWETTGYIGAAAALLLIAAMAGKHPQRHLWLGVAIVSILLSLGPYIPFYQGFVKVVPGAGLFRGPGRYLLLFTVAATVLAGLGFESLWTRDQFRFRIPALLLSLAMSCQLLISAAGILKRESPDELRWPKRTEDALRSDLGLEYRVATTRVEEIGFCQAAGLDNIGGYEPLMLRRYTELMNAASGSPISRDIVIMASVGSHPVIDMLGVAIRLDTQATGDRRRTYRENPGTLPRAWLVNNAVVIESKEERLKVLAKGPWDPRKTVLLEEYPAEAPPVPTEASAGRAKLLSRAPGEYVLEAENAADAYLVLSEAWYPGWRAEIDGKSAEVLPANHLIQAIRLPPGKHVVRFSYRSRYLGWGLGVALLAAMVPVAIALVGRRRR
jgi:hypothetical protein